MNLSTKPIYLLPAKIPVTITNIRAKIADTNEKMANPLQLSTNLNRTNISTIAAIVSIPEIAIIIRWPFPLHVVISPPASNGKKEDTITPKIEPIMNRIGLAKESSPLFTPQCIPI